MRLGIISRSMMHTTKTALLLVAVALSASCAVSSPQPDFGLEELWDNLNKTGQVILDGLANATKNGTAITGEFLDGVKNATAQYSHETVEFAHKIAQALHRAATEGIADFSSDLRSVIEQLRGAINQVRNVVKRKALKDALAALQTVNATVADLEAAVENLNDRLEEEKEKYAAEIQEKWSNWADAQLDRVDQETNGVGNQEAEEILDELVSRYSGYLQSCVEELQVRQGIYEQNVHRAIVKYHNATNNVSAQIELCLQSPLGILSCRSGINQALSGLKTAPAELLSLKLQGLRLLAVGLDAGGCVGQTLEEHELEKPSVERKLDEIIQDYLNQQNASDDDSSSEEDSTTEDVSDLQGSSSPDDDDSSSEEGSTTEDVSDLQGDDTTKSE